MYDPISPSEVINRMRNKFIFIKKQANESERAGIVNCHLGFGEQQLLERDSSTLNVYKQKSWWIHIENASLQKIHPVIFYHLYAPKSIVH